MDNNLGELEFLRPEEVARMLRCGRTKAYQLLRANSIPSYFVGRNRIVERSAVIAWLSEQRCQAEETRHDPSR